jgi:murein DD-endopeptidase MepM/ murein hydrolase activator NlpD
MTTSPVLTYRPCGGKIFLPYGAYYRDDKGRIVRPWYAPDGIHRGDDYVAYFVPIFAAHDGTGDVQNDGNGWGLYVKILADGWQTISAHLSKVLVTKGQHIKAGDQIGISGDSGSAKNYHHFHHELRACSLRLPDTGPRCQQAPGQFFVQQTELPPPPVDSRIVVSFVPSRAGINIRNRPSEIASKVVAKTQAEPLPVMGNAMDEWGRTWYKLGSSVYTELWICSITGKAVYK